MEKHHKLLVVLLIVLGFSLRLYYFASPLGRSSEVTVDEAVYGIQAIRIMNGDRPVFYPAQDYTGSFSAYISAAVFSIFGVTVWGLKIVPFIFSVGTVWLIYLLAKKTFSQNVGLFTLLIAALGTPFWNNWSSRAGTGYVEATFVGLLLLLTTLQITQKENTSKNLMLYFTGLGFLSGLGFWMQPTIVYFIIPSMIFLFANLRRRFFVPFIFFCLGFMVGGFPVIYYNVLIKPSGTTGALFKKPWGVRGALLKLLSEGFPVLLGGRTSNSTKDFNFLTSSFIYLFFVFSVFYFLKVVSVLRSVKRPEFLILLTTVSTIAIFLTSTPFNQLSIEPRYIFSLYSVIPIFLGTFMERVARFSTPVSLAVILLFSLNSILGLTMAGPPTFLDGYSFKPLVSFLSKQRVDYIVSTPSLGHRVMFLSGGVVKASVRGGGITEVRFEKTNQEVTRARDLDPRLVAYVCKSDEPELDSFRTEGLSQYGQNYLEENIGGAYTVIYSNKSVPKLSL